MAVSEKEIIDIITLGQYKAPNRYGIGDDGAHTGAGFVISHDTMVEDVHFNKRLSPYDVGWKIVAINASDIAAMGHNPEWATLSISAPITTNKEWFLEFSKGMRKALKHWNINLLGGDTTRSNHSIMVSMAMGSRKGNITVWRGGAKVGDDIWVTGTLGNAAYGFFHLDSTIGIKDLQRPNPPVRFASSIASFNIVHAMTDISDGLHTDLRNICEASSVGAVIVPDQIPKGSELWQEKNALSYATAFGEDYQMLFTCYSGVEDIIRQSARLNKVRVTKIGTIISDKNKIKLKGNEWPPSLFEHFSS
jgi:thiamine-monophosphate kinase